MKRLLVYILLLVSIGVSGQNILHRRYISPSSSEGDSLIAYFRLENDETDEQNNYNGTPVSSWSYLSTSPKEGTYNAEFDSSPDGIDIGSVNFGSNGFTVSLWHRHSNASNSLARVLFSNGYNSTAGGFAIWLNTWAQVDGMIRVYTWDTTPNQDGANSSSGVYVNNTWNHICVVYEGSGAWKIYVNNVDVTSDGTTQDDFTTSGNTTVIGNYSTYNFVGLGEYDLIKIFNIPFDSDGVNTLYNE